MSSSQPPANGQLAVRTLDLTKSYGTSHAPVHALRDVTIELRRGGRVALLGKSGAASYRADAWIHSIVAGKFPVELEDRLLCFHPGWP